jgi:ribosome-binding protein aMBF1 (putative translation factor)
VEIISQQKSVPFSTNNKPLPRTALEPVCEALANVIRQRRERTGLSLNQFASRTNLSRPMIRFIETSERIPTIDTVARISRALGIPLSQLVIEAEGRLKL